MLSNQKNKRKSAGFIRTSSVKALHNFKKTDLSSSSSSDFSSFQNQNLQPEKSEYQFSPYKNSYSTKERYPLPPRPPVSKPHVSGKLRKEDAIEENDPNKIFTNQRITNNYQFNNNPRGEPGLVVSKREEQIRQNLRKRAQVERQLKDINKVCAEVDKIRSPYLKGQGANSRFFKADGAQVSSRKNLDKIHRGQDVVNIEQESEQQFSHFNQSNQRQKINQQSFKPSSIKFSKVNEHCSQKKYEFQQSSIKQQSQSDSEDFGAEDFRNNQIQQQFSKYQYGETFHPNANKQILTSIEQYKKKYIPSPSQMTIQGTRSPGSFHKKNFTEQGSEEYLKEEHHRAREKFISINNDEEQSLIQEYPTDQFKKTTIKDAYRTQNGSNQYKSTGSINRDGIYTAKGGICFDLDINQFTNLQGNHENIQKRPNLATNKVVQGGLMKKKRKVNQKEEILKRRQMAKNYDREARARVFGGY